VVRAQIGRSQQRVLEALHRGQEPVNVH
jgi:hypothetical protein